MLFIQRVQNPDYKQNPDEIPQVDPLVIQLGQKAAGLVGGVAVAVVGLYDAPEHGHQRHAHTNQRCNSKSHKANGCCPLLLQCCPYQHPHAVQYKKGYHGKHVAAAGQHQQAGKGSHAHQPRRGRG